MPKKLIVCFDGTWKNANSVNDSGESLRTNVYKFMNLLNEKDDQNQEQKVFYHPGLGGENLSFLKNHIAGANGKGITRHICSAYHWLALNYCEGDEIYLIGFSRGAFTVRCLASMVISGLLDLKGVDYQESLVRVEQAYLKGYRKQKKISEIAKSNWKFFNAQNQNVTPIEFLGVWDTVGSLGIPDELSLLNIFDRSKKWRFHDNKLSEHVKKARHAMALDEMRTTFVVSRWENANTHPGAQEKWFAGVHSDIGGGYTNSDLSDITLKWMIEESGLSFHQATIDQFIKPNPQGEIHQSVVKFYTKLRTRPRNVPNIINENKDEFHPSVFKRQELNDPRFPKYRTQRSLKVGESYELDILAAEHWNSTDVYLAKDEQYVFSAKGKWLDKKDLCDWNGTKKSAFSLGGLIRIAGSFIGIFERLFIHSNKNIDLAFSRRDDSAPWLMMLGAIANDSGEEVPVKNDGSPVLHQFIKLPKYQKESFTVKQPGYLFCFANDSWATFNNNFGYIQLTITRIG